MNSNEIKSTNKTTAGIILLIVGVIGLVAVYSMRPPSGLGDALMMLGQGRDHFIKEPFYQIFMAASFLISLSGIIHIFKGMSANKHHNS